MNVKVGDLVRVSKWCSWYGDSGLHGIGIVVKLLDDRAEAIVFIEGDFRTLHVFFLEVITNGKKG